MMDSTLQMIDRLQSENKQLQEQSQKDRELLKEIQSQCSIWKLNNKSKLIDEIYERIKKHLEGKNEADNKTDEVKI